MDSFRHRRCLSYKIILFQIQKKFYNWEDLNSDHEALISKRRHLFAFNDILNSHNCHDINYFLFLSQYFPANNRLYSGFPNSLGKGQEQPRMRPSDSWTMNHRRKNKKSNNVNLKIWTLFFPWFSLFREASWHFTEHTNSYTV